MVLVAVEDLDDDVMEHLSHVYSSRAGCAGVVVVDKEDGRETLGEVHVFAQLWPEAAEEVDAGHLELVYCAVLADLQEVSS